jgi:fructosamine-3-kinase
MIPAVILRDLVLQLGAIDASSMTDWQPVGGGSINSAFVFSHHSEKYFIKFNNANAYPGMPEAEREGLSHLRNAGVRVPEVIATGISGSHAWLLLRRIIPGKRVADFEEQFGRMLAVLHHRTEKHFGSMPDNWIGSLPQVNTDWQRWSDFFREQRLDPLLRSAVDHRLLPPGVTGLAERLYAKLDVLFPSEPPSLLHGDLWSGNRMVGEEGLPVLIDPAVYYGFREMDLAMIRLFGGFDRRWEEAYAEAFPWSPGVEDRIGLCNLYPLLVHLLLFGGGYATDFLRQLRYFTGEQ